MHEIRYNCVPGTSIKIGNEKRELINKCIEVLLLNGFTEISLPTIQYNFLFAGYKEESPIYKLTDKVERQLCLAPDLFTPLKHLLDRDLKNKIDYRLFFVQQCFLDVKIESLRDKESTVLGVAVLNPTGLLGNEKTGNVTTMEYLQELAEFFIKLKTMKSAIIVNSDTRDFSLSTCEGKSGQDMSYFYIDIDRLLTINN